jgi:hypothetical protein
LADGYGNLPPATAAEAAMIAVERAMACLSQAQRAATTSRMKWSMVKGVHQRAGLGCGVLEAD